MDEILYTLCQHNVAIMDSWYPFPATAIARSLGLSVGKVRYHLRKLKKQGLVNSFHYGGMTEDGEVDLMENFDSSKWEIIGNIFDNPELLESEE